MTISRSERVPFVLGTYLTGSATNGDAWRVPGEDTDADLEFSRYRDYVSLLEKGRFDAIFLYDNVLPVRTLPPLPARRPCRAGIRSPCWPRWP
ncbi:hypothetical protein [Acetobacter oeni]|uniref:Luciferase-like domain-containing protein n=1 Tax=Acetobacter oeni TaxID=304077 RepID=A0A511XK15_9PROT|nr:hypothetical protein [Acetobacter oeni]MBB3883482.1 hypothetical protein [Acetobacter oeni]GBR04104.1 hypothetical protein AA21952_1307 [Acetobacter oeni LMG 21952]GEN63261.1 hypothetical protein AOE01nite_14850 [Acetobacter oeni]